MVSRLISALGSAAVTALGLLFAVVIFGGPAIVYYTLPVQAYHVSLWAAYISVPVSMLLLLLSISKKVRPFAGIGVYICAFIVLAFLWIWSVLIVGSTWGIGTLYFVNFFLGVGTIVAAFAVALFGGHWSMLGQLLLTVIVLIAMSAAAGRNRGAACPCILNRRVRAF